jgi:hypothetical protein
LIFSPEPAKVTSHDPLVFGRAADGTVSSQPGAPPPGERGTMLQEPLPPALPPLLGELDFNDPPLLTTAADLSHEGEFEQQWLVVSADRLVVLAGGPKPRVLRVLPVEAVESFRAHAVVGSGFLQARVDGVWVDLLRYSNGLANRFAKVAGKLEQLRNEGELTVLPGE